MIVTAAATAVLPASPRHLSHVLGQSRARLTRQADLGQSLQLAIWSNRDDEVHYRQQGHHTLSVYLAGGAGSQLKGNAAARGEAGRFCILPAEHESLWVVREPVQFLHLYVSDIAWADRVVRLLDAEPRCITLTPQIYASDPAYTGWAQAVQRLNWADVEDAWLASHLCGEILDRMVIQSAAPRQRQGLCKPLGGLSSVVRRRVLEYVDAHLADPQALSLATLAQVAALSEYHFARMFHQSMGCTVHAWVLFRRLDKVRQRLQMRKKTTGLRELASDTGFSSASHLLRSFHKHFGLTPTQAARCERDA